MNEEIAHHKKLLRQLHGNRRNALAERSERSQRIRKRVLAMQAMDAAKMVCCFVSFRSEVETRELIRELLAAGKKICVPWCNGDVLGLCQIESLDELKPRTMGILEPPPALRENQDRQCKISDAQVVIVPGLAFSETGARLGYGKGHYDRMLASSPETVRVAVGFECQIETKLPTNQYDMPMHFVVTEDRLIECTGR